MPETNIKKMRKAAGLTQKELAEKANINLRLLQHYEQGFKNINNASAEKVLDLADVLQCDPRQLLN